MQHLLGAEGVFEHMISRREARLRIAAPEMIIQRNIGAAAAFEMLKIGKSRSRLQFGMDEYIRAHRLHFIVDRRKFFIFCHDKSNCFLCNVTVSSEHDGDRLPCKSALAIRKDRLVVKGRPVIGIRNDRPDIVDRYDTINALESLGRRHIDVFDARMRKRAAENFSIKHTWKPQMVNIFGPPSHFLSRFETRNRVAYVAV